MAKLYFEIEADYKKVVKLREEIEKLQRTMKGFGSHTSANEIKKLEAELKSLREEYGRLTVKAAKSAASIEKSGLSMGKALAAVGGVAALKSLGSEIIRVRGQFQEMETSIETLVGKKMADKLLPQIKELAKVSPLTMTDIVGAEKMMLGFNIEADKTIGFLKALSDVSMGSSSKFNSLTLAFSQMSAAGKLMGQDLNQMINAGFNPLQQISLTTGKSIATLKEEMSKGAISAEMVQKAFIDATSAGGKFYKMSENAAKTINGQISMMEDAWDSALNEMGQKSEGFIMEGIQATTSLIQNYETVGRVLVGLVATYGTYKAALIATIALEKAQVISRLAAIKHTSLLSTATGVLTKKVALLNAVAKTNPYVLLATALVGVGTAMWALSDHTTEAEKGLAAYNREQEKAANKQTDAKRQLEEWVSVLNDENAGYGKRQEAMMKMKAVYGDLAAQFMDEKGHITDLTGLWEQYGKKAWEAKKKAKEAEIADLQMAYNSAEWSYNLNEKSNDRSKMKDAKNKMDYLLPQIEQAKKDLEQINSEAPKDDKKEDTNYRTAYDTAKKDWEEAKKKLSEIKRNKDKYTKQEYEKAKADEATKKKIYEGLGGKTDKQIQKEVKQEQKLSQELLSVKRDNQQKEIDLMKEGSEKKRKQIELDYQLELDKIAKQKEEWKNAQGGKLTDEQQATLGWLYINAEAGKESALAQVLDEEKQAMFDYLKKFGNFEEKRKGIIGSFTQKIENAATEGEKLTFIAQMKKELADLDTQVQGKTNSIAKLFEDMSERSIAYIREIADDAETMIAYFKTGQWEEVKNEKGEGTGKDAWGFSKEQFEELIADPSKINDIIEKIKELRKTANDMDSVFNKMGKAFKNLFSKDNANWEQDLNVIIEGVGEVNQAAEFLGGTLSQISDAFGGNFLGGIAEGIGVATEAVNGAMSGAQAGAVFGPWGAAAGAAIGLVGSLTSSLSKLHDKKHEKKIQKLAEQIEVLEKNYEKLGKSIEKAYSKDAKNLIEDQNKLLEQQKILIQQQIREEEKKKKTDKNRIKEWQEQIEDINETIEDNKEKAKDAIFGSDLQSAIEDFASAYAEAWAAGEDKAKSAKDMVRSMIKNMIMEAVKMASSSPMEKLRDMMLSFWSDSYISLWEEEQLQKAAVQLQEDLDKQFGWADRFMNDSSYSQEASSKGFQTMSQDTADELNGRFTALQIAGEEIRTHASILSISVSEIKGINAGIKDIAVGIQDQLANSYLELVSINENTGLSAKYLKDIKTDIADVKENIKNL